MKNAELMGALKVVKNDGTITIINEGDYVTCCVGENQYYVGTLSRIGYWQTNEMKTLPVAIAIEGKNPKTASSTSVILLSDIKWIHKMSEEERKEIEELISKISQADTTENE